MMKVNWIRKIYSNGRHNYALGNIVKWEGSYYVSFVDASYHGSYVAEDSKVRVISSTDLENWTSQIVVGKTLLDPQLLPIGDKLFLYTHDTRRKDDVGPLISHELVMSTRDGHAWSKARRCFLMNYDFWTPTAYNGCYYVACDNCGHISEDSFGTVDLLTSNDGERWSWVSEIVRGSEEFTRMPSETALCFLDDGYVIAVIRTGLTRFRRAALATSRPPYEKWEHQIIPFTLKGVEIAKVGDHILVTGRCLDEERDWGTELTNHCRTGVFSYEDGRLSREILLPSGGDTGYSGILPVSESEVLVAYYSAHEYYPNCVKNAREGPADIYLASVSLV